MSQGGDGIEIEHDPQKLLTAATHLDAFSDKAKVAQGAAKANSSISGHEWGLVGVAFSMSYKDTAQETIDHIGMITKFLSDAEASMTATARHYAGANETILKSLSMLERDIPTMGKPKK
jgi:hypothetical protein